jgi:hypothetical protein
MLRLYTQTEGRLSLEGGFSVPFSLRRGEPRTGLSGSLLLGVMGRQGGRYFRVGSARPVWLDALLGGR